MRSVGKGKGEERERERERERQRERERERVGWFGCIGHESEGAAGRWPLALDALLCKQQNAKMSNDGGFGWEVIHMNLCTVAKSCRV